MKHFRQALWLIAMLVATHAASAGDLVLRKPDGSFHRIPIRTTDTIAMAPGGGSVRVTPMAQQGVAGDGWCPSATPVPPAFTASLSATPNPAPSYSNVMTTWSTSNATSCSTAGSTFPAGVTSVSGWPASVPVWATNRAVGVTSPGQYVLKLTCTGPGGSASSQRTVVVF